jgi:hypothetical protein
LIGASNGVRCRIDIFEAESFALIDPDRPNRLTRDVGWGYGKVQLSSNLFSASVLLDSADADDFWQAWYRGQIQLQ